LENTIPHQQLFDRFAFGYYIVDILSFGFAGYLRRQALDKTPFVNGSTVIDLMCGTGNNAAYILKKPIENLKYIGIDISENMIDCAIRKYQYAGSTIVFRKANVFHYFSESGKSTHLLCSYGLKCVQASDYHTFVETIDSALEKKGTFSLVEFQFPSNRLLRYLMKFYLQTVYKTGCLITTGSMKPAEALIHSISSPVELSILRDLFIKKGFEIKIEKKWMNSVIFIYGRKCN
jgi:ubiquinone/menaquinone biosynthesis C-methylase UbiE